MEVMRNKEFSFHSCTINQTLTFGSNDTSKAITFNIADDEIPSEPTEQFDISLYGTHEKYNILFDPNQKTTINIKDNGKEFNSLPVDESSQKRNSTL